MVSWRKPFSGRSGADVATADSASQISDGSITYIGEKGGNNAAATYQEASGAPVESDSPLGYAVGPLTILLLNISMMIGTGIYSTREILLRVHPWVGVTNMAKLPLFWEVLGLSV